MLCAGGGALRSTLPSQHCANWGWVPKLLFPPAGRARRPPRRPAPPAARPRGPPAGAQPPAQDRGPPALAIPPPAGRRARANARRAPLRAAALHSGARRAALSEAPRARPAPSPRGARAPRGGRLPGRRASARVYACICTPFRPAAAPRRRRPGAGRAGGAREPPGRVPAPTAGRPAAALAQQAARPPDPSTLNLSGLSCPRPPHCSSSDR